MPRIAKEKVVENEEKIEKKTPKKADKAIAKTSTKDTTKSKANAKPKATAKADDKPKKETSKKVESKTKSKAKAEEIVSPAKKTSAKRASSKTDENTSAKRASSKTDENTSTKKAASKTIKKAPSKTSEKVTSKSTKAGESVKAKRSTKAIENKEVKQATKTASSSKKASEQKKVAKSKTKKATEKKEDKKTSSSEKKVTTRRKRSTSKKAAEIADIQILEYYDLPYKYGNTIVKLLAQTPKTLFVYWEISDEDINNFKQKYGNDFFNITKPILIVHNLTLNKTSEIEINDFANCWYLNTEDADCKYDIELARKFIKSVSAPVIAKANDYLYVAKSNELESPNDHIMFEKLTESITFKNYKTSQTIVENFESFKFLRDIYKFYQNMYKDELLKNPSSKF